MSSDINIFNVGMLDADHQDDAGHPWCAEMPDVTRDYEPMGLAGPTALIAAMRVFVNDELGDEIDAPEGPEQP